MTPSQHRAELAVDIALAWLIVWFLYRAGLHVSLHSAMVWAGAWQDLAWTGLATLVALLLGWRWRWTGVLMTLPILTFCVVDARAYAILLAALHQGVDRTWVRDAYLSGELLAVDANTQPSDVALIAGAPLLRLTLRWLPAGRARVRPVIVLALAALFALLPLLAPARPAQWSADAVQNPLGYLMLHDAELDLAGFPIADPLPADVSSTQPLRPTDPRLMAPGPTAKTLPEPAEKPWNVVWIIMESTGTRYFEGETFPGRPPMPTLRKLADEGWYLAHHQSPSNSSATSIFAMLSGLSPAPQMQMFSIQPDNYVPALPRFLPSNYEKFLYTPGKLSYFFPKPFLQHSGLTELVGFAESTVTAVPPGEGLCKDEIAVMSTFLDRLARAHEPFLAMYYSYVPHWPYTDYGPATRHYTGQERIDQYHNSLWLLDTQIARVIEQLRKQGALDRTILVLTGDHGEAFGQHARNWAHARGSYRENFETPAVFWQPKLFAPRRIEHETQHIDLLPTLLDAMRVPYDEAMLQGESLFDDAWRRKVQFFWANEGMLTAQRDDGVKLSWSPMDKRCRVVDLRADWLEQHPRPCDKYLSLLEILEWFRGRQLVQLPAYSEAVRLGKPFGGHSVGRN